MAIERINQVSNIATATSVSNSSSANKNLQTQLLVKQQNLKQLSTDSRLSVEEKEKQRQELQKEIEALKRKLEQIKERAEEQDVKEVEAKEKLEKVSKEKEDSREISATEKSEEDKKKQEPISAEDVQKMIQYDLFLKDEMVQQGVAYDKENWIRVLSSEMNQDEMRGVDTSSKKEQLKEMQEKENFWLDAKNKQAEKEKSTVIDPDIQVKIS